MGSGRSTQITLRDPRAIRALAHPARLAIIDELYGGRVATATELAAVTGLSANATGWHVQALAKLGIIERAPDSGDARERPWQAAGDGVAVDARLSSSAQRGAAAALATAAVEALGRDLATYAATEVDLPDEWQARSNFDAGAVYLTPEEATALIEALNEAMEPFRRRTRRRRGAERVRIAAAVVPLVPPSEG